MRKALVNTRPMSNNADFEAIQEKSIFSYFTKDKDKIHPAELASVINELRDDQAIHAFVEISESDEPRVFPYLDKKLQFTILGHLSNQKVAHILNSLDSDDRMDFFNRLTLAKRGRFLSLLNAETKKSTQDLLGYPEDSVARLINTDFVALSSEMTVNEVFDQLRKEQRDSEVINTLYIEDESGKLVDDMPLRRLVLNSPDKKLSEIMDNNYIALNMNDTRETAIIKFKEYDRVTMPVVNDHNEILGIITVDDILDIIEEEETEDAMKFGGVEDLDFPYVDTPFFSLIQKRAGWLIVLFIGEMLTATAMGFFEEEIAAAVVLALFIPLVISSGGNSGSQAATLIIRAMALKELSVKDWWYVMKREILSGLTLGVILGTIGFMRITFWHLMHWYDYGDHWLLIAFTIFFSLIGIVLWGTLSGSMIPILLKKFNLDPATSSAPFVATMVDVTGLIIYFSIAATILRGTLL
ncbi:MAG: magnesium transporter [Bacteroidetes bacterium OLB9]|nr:MAG: magnesium transporter [Bacteroidetes bacterium OLB9]